MKSNKLKLTSLDSVELLQEKELKIIHGGIGDRPGDVTSRKYDSTSYDSKKKDTWGPPPPSQV